MWVGLGVFVVLAGGFLGVLTWALRLDDPTDLLAADEAERGPEPIARPRGRHRSEA